MGIAIPLPPSCVVTVLLPPSYLMHDLCSPQALEAAALVSSHQLEEHLLLTRLNAAQLDDVNSGEGAGPAQLGYDARGSRETGSPAAVGVLEMQRLRTAVSEAAERSAQARASMELHEQRRGEALGRAEGAARRLEVAGKAADPRARARDGVEAALRLQRAASEATAQVAEAQRGLREAREEAERAEARAVEQEGAAVAVQAASPYRPSLASSSGRLALHPNLASTPSPYKASLVQMADRRASPPFTSPELQDGVGVVLELGRRYRSTARALRDRIHDVLQPGLAALSREAEGLRWEAAVAVHRARSLVAHSNILGIGGSADAAAGGSARSPPGPPSAGPFKQAQAMAACHVLDSELAAAALQLRRVHWIVENVWMGGSPSSWDPTLTSLPLTPLPSSAQAGPY